MWGEILKIIVTRVFFWDCVVLEYSLAKEFQDVLRVNNFF